MKREELEYLKTLSYDELKMYFNLATALHDYEDEKVKE